MFSFAIFVPLVLLATTKNQVTKFWIVFHKMCKCYDVIDGELVKYFCELNRNEVTPRPPRTWYLPTRIEGSSLFQFGHFGCHPN